MDSSGNYQVAFAKYLQSLSVLSLYLNEMFASFGFQKMLERNKEVKQVLSMIHECSDRMTVIVDGGKKESPKNTIPKKNSVSNVQPCSDFTTTYTKKFPAFEKLENDNMALIKRYQWRFEKATDKNAKANLKLELERQLIENDLIAKKKYNEVSFLTLITKISSLVINIFLNFFVLAVKKLQKERVRLMENEMKKLLESNQNLNEKQKEKQELYLSVLQYTKTETWPCTWKLNNLEITSTEAAEKIFLKTVRCSRHPLAQWLLVMQTNIKREIDTMLKRNSIYQALLPECPLIMEEDELSVTENSKEFLINSSKAGAVQISKIFLLSLKKFLENISLEITNTIENILEIFYLIYKSLLPDDSEEICHRLIENHILDPIWPNIFILFRILNLPSEYKTLETMIAHRNSDPKKFGFSSKEDIGSEVYTNSILLLQRLTNSNSMTEKLGCLVDVAKTICGNFSSSQMSPNRRRLYMFGEEGYALSSFLTALKYIEIRKIIDEQNGDDQN
ncbi:VPS9 domain-containing protein 1 [Trichonephila inaurata madagascariensis]|uniref:VPS9 domain-containing protein 1 n=1 Tax=Trichonephila inaurata madagascariensis TaxID=2747483 RepID=A0A8X6YFS0_9ARAC|nr:VPS9 domain-containing protein 1 [Trichonephila inaurata madagascariensis]